MRRHEPDDQAAGLRRLLGGGPRLSTASLFGPDPSLNAQACANLTFALSQRGGKVCLIDEAPGPQNCFTQFGLGIGHNLADALQRRVAIDDVLVPFSDDLQLLPAHKGLTLAAESDERAWNRLGSDLAQREWAWFMLAAPADDQASLALAAPLRILVLPPQRARLTEAYAVLKAVHNRQPDAHWLALCMQAEMETAEQNVAALNETAQRFLGVEIGLLGAVPRDAQMDRAARSMRLVLEASPTAPAAQALRQIAEQLDDHAVPTAWQTDVTAFWQRLGLIGRLNRPDGRPKYPAHQGRAYG